MPAVYCNSIGNIVWYKASADSFILNTTVDVWRVPVSLDPQLLNYFRTTLHPDELDKAMRYHHEKDMQRFITSRATLRLLLGKYLDKPPGDIQLIKGTNKKPFVQITGVIDLHYNISHSGDWILIAVSDAEIGVDVEKIDHQFSYEDILRMSFSAPEINAIKKSSSPGTYFYLHWTRKEALIKATAKGLDDDLTSIPCLDGLHTISAEIAGTAASWTVSSFEVGDDYIGSVAYQPIKKNIRFLEL